MPLSIREKSLLIVTAILVAGVAAQAQRSQPMPATAQINVSSPLPVYVANATLPEGFVPGSRWRFTTYSTPSVLTWTATVSRVSGQWALLTVQTEGGSVVSRWHYVPAMPGSWEPQ